MSRRAIIRVGPGDATLRGRWLGARLREQREDIGLTGAEVGKRMDRSHSAISRWESGESIPRRPELLYLLDLYDVHETVREELLSLYVAAREQRDAAETVSAAVADYDWLERRAERLEEYADIGVPGLLQTPDYARAILRALGPVTNPDRLERTVAARIDRQQRLTDKEPLRLTAILDESVLRRPVGGPEVMRAQLRHLVDRAALPNLDVRVVPFSAGVHAGFLGPFTILHFPNERAIVQSETRAGDIYFDDPEPFARVVRRLRKVALSTRKSAALIAAASREMT